MMLRKLVKVTDAENKEVFFSIFFKDLKKKRTACTITSYSEK